MRTPNFPHQIETRRLIIREWRDADRAPFAAMCADPRVMEYLPDVLDRTESDAYIDRNLARQRDHDFCFWAMEMRATGAFAGSTGLKKTEFDARFTPNAEFGWRLPFALWGKGLATEAAAACLHYGFSVLGLPEIVAVSASVNNRSRAVMERIGMSHDPSDDFIHPLMDPDHPLQPCVLYRMAASAYSTKEMSR